MFRKLVVPTVLATTLFCLQGCGSGNESNDDSVTKGAANSTPVPENATAQDPRLVPSMATAEMAEATTTAAPSTWVTAKLVATDTECYNNVKSLGGNTAQSSIACAQLVATDPSCSEYFEYHALSKRCSCLAPGISCAEQPDGDVDRYVMAQVTAKLVAADRECSNNVATLFSLGKSTATSSAGCAQLVAADSSCGPYFEYHGVTRRCSCLGPGATCVEHPDGDVDRYLIVRAIQASTMPSQLWEESAIKDEDSPSAAQSSAAINLFMGCGGFGILFVTISVGRRRWIQPSSSRRCVQPSPRGGRASWIPLEVLESGE